MHAKQSTSGTFEAKVFYVLLYVVSYVLLIIILLTTTTCE